MKKIAVLIICFLIGLMQIIYAAEIYTDYDFSDEAQEEFNRRQEIFINTQPANDFQVRKEKINRQNVDNNLIQTEIYKSEYTLPEIQGTQQIFENMITVPAGEKICIQLKSGISSGSLDPGDSITGELADDWTYANRLIAPKGSLVYGVVTNVEAAGTAYGDAALKLDFPQIMTPAGTVIDTPVESFRLEKRNHRAKNITKNTAVGTGLGLLGGLAWFALTGGDLAGSLAIAGGLGLAGGVLFAVTERGEDIVIETDTIIDLVLSRAINVPPYLEN